MAIQVIGQHLETHMSLITKKLLILPSMLLGLVSMGLSQGPPQASRALLDAVWNGDLYQVCALIEKGADVNSRGDFRYTPLIIAAKHGRFEIAKVLCEKGADVNAVASADAAVYGERGLTPLLGLRPIAI